LDSIKPIESVNTQKISKVRESQCYFPVKPANSLTIALLMTMGWKNTAIYGWKKKNKSNTSHA
jgi:hypothetical protein